MITRLTVENLAIIEEAQLELEGGFTVFTGETGAGKSLLADAVQLVLGGRADTDQVRTGFERSTITMEVDLSAFPAIGAKIRSLGIDLPDGSPFSVVREVYASGRSACRICGKASPAAMLREAGKLLADLHGQHDHQQLLNPELHVKALDDWIGEPASEARSKAEQAWTRMTATKRRLDALRSGRREWERQIDGLRFQIEEIEKANPEPGELEAVEARIERLKHAERLAEAANEALQMLVESESPVMDGLGESIKLIEGASRFDPALEDVNAPLKESLFNLQEAVHLLRSYADEIEADPALLEDSIARQDVLLRLRRKYGDDEAAVLQHLEEAKLRLAELTDFEGDEESLAAEFDAQEEELARVCEELTRLRKAHASSFEEAVRSQLNDLAMNQAKFEIDMTAVEPGPQGADRVEFLFSANLGEPVKPLAKIASGGEMSRTMLAIKTALGDHQGVPTLIFDEVDAGLSGQAAAAVSKKLELLGKSCQVIVISHLPQIASRADHHFRIEKRVKGGRTVTAVVKLDPQEREQEIARLIAGETITEASLAHARELLGTGA